MSIYVGIGTSAGGLKVLEELVKLLPENSQYVYLIAQHLSKDKKSSLVEILSRSSSIPVKEVPQDCKFSKNCVYVMPPGYNMELYGGKLRLVDVSKSELIPTPSINLFLESIAKYKKSKAIGIILTGSGDDGAQGLSLIQEHGGVTIVQAPQEAEHSSMPLSALESTDVDYTFFMQEIGNYFCSGIEMSESVEKIIEILHEKENANIKKYKNETIIRRINKRMLLAHVKSPEEYLEYIKSNSQELRELHKNILIGVTSFFRDRDAYEALRKELIEYFRDKSDKYEFRVWSVACSTGEEAYSLAILVSEINKSLNKEIELHLFATDIDDGALTKARKAFYTKESLVYVEKSLRDEYFIEYDSGYKLVQSIRQKIVFTHHNILSDPPFINMDMISCRNFLIYILPEIQKEIFTLFNYSMKENALLFLGSSESAMLSSNYFSSLNSEYKIYHKEKLNKPPKISNRYFSKHLESLDVETKVKKVKKEKLSIEEILQETIFTFFAPNCIVIDKHYSIIYKKGELPFLKMADGFVSLNILENIDEALRYDVSRLIEKSFESNTIESTKFIELLLPSAKELFLRTVAYPFEDPHNTPIMLLYFQELSSGDLQFNGKNLMLPDESFMIKSLSSQLSDTRMQLHSVSDELLLHKESMQLLNEELQSSNEELQSSNEELETSNEELQSSNEELHASILDTQNLQEQLSLILNSSQDAIIGLDREGRHTFVNSAALELLGYTQDEMIGKSGHSLWHYAKEDGSSYPLEECSLHSSNSLGISQRVEDLFYKKDGTAIEVEVLQNPITKNGKIVGALLSFHDISEKNRLKRLSMHEHKLADLYLNMTGNIVMKLDVEGNIDLINTAGAKLLGVTESECIGKNWFDNFIDAENTEEIKDVFKAVMSSKEEIISHYTNQIIDRDKQVHLIAWSNSLVKDIDGNIDGLITSGTDITKEKALSVELSHQEYLYRLTFEEADVGIAHVSFDGKWIDTNNYLSNLLGYTKREFKTLDIYEITHKDDYSSDKMMMQELLSEGNESYSFEKRYIHKKGHIVWVHLNVVLLRDEFNKPLYILKIIRDISEVKMLMYQLEVEKNELNRIVEFTPIPIMIHNEDGEIVLINKAFVLNSGYLLDDLLNMDLYMKKLYKHTDEKKRVSLKKDYESIATQKEHVIRTKEGSLHTWLLQSTRLHGSSSRKNAFISSVIDITDIKNKDEIMIAQSRQAAMGDMLAMISHQWRQPLSVISMNTNILRANQELEEEISSEDITSFIDAVDKQVSYLSETIDDFRSFFKPKKLKEIVKISSVIDKLSTLVETTLINNQIDFEVVIEKDIELYTYPNQLIQIMINLISNAKDAILSTKPTQPLVRIIVESREEQIIIKVCDNGGGIDSSIQDTISQPYVSTKSKNGTGLGLYMSTIIAKKNLDGYLTWSSDEEGSCFSINMPNNRIYEEGE